MVSWLDFWNSDNPIYVNERHRAVHYRQLAEEIASILLDGAPRVLDFGCGDALSADIVADRAGRLLLCDGAERVRARLATRFAGHPRIAVVSPDDVATLPDASLDLVVANSVVQYMTRPELDAFLALAHAKLQPYGCLLLGDIVPPSVGPATDATALLRLGWQNGFLAAATVGLARTFFSSYRATRATLGLLHLDERELSEMLTRAGYASERQPRNLGHNQARMTFAAMKCRPAATE
ncbi:MAG: class I SAM-dependent methyltransferase [Pseudomonadota bacterium]